MTCRPTSRAAAADVFGFGDDDMQAQSLRNMALMWTLPWAAVWAFHSELAEEALSRIGLG